MNQVFYPNTGCQWLAGLTVAGLATCQLRLWKWGELEVSVTVTHAMLLAAEADYSGYPTSGITIEDFLAPILAPEGGYSIQSATVQFATATPTTVGNVIGGWWLEDSEGVPVIIAGFDSGWPMEVPGQGLPIDVRLVFPNGGGGGGP